MFEEKNKKTLFFQISIAVILTGILFYLMQELVYAMARTSYNVFVVLADFVGIFAIIALILWMFLPKFQALIKNIAIILSLSYVFLFLFGHLLAPRSLGAGGNVLEQFASINLSFIGLLILFFFTIGLLVIFGMRFTKQDEFAIYEKFVIILWLVTLGIFGSIHLYYIRVFTTFDPFFVANLGITFLPRNLELIYALFGAILLIISFFVGINKKILSLLTLLFINIIAFTLVIGSIGQIGFDFSDRMHTPYIMGNFLIIIGTISLAVCTFFILQMKYPKSLAKQQ